MYQTYKKSKSTILLVAHVIGNIVASFSAVPLRPLFYGVLETDKIVGLKRHRQNYYAEIELSNEACSEFVGGNITLKILFRI